MNTGRVAYATTDLSDAHTDVQIAEPIWRSFGGRAAFHGRARTVRVHEDNALVRAELETPGEGRALVVDGGGSLRCALLGDLLGALAVQHGRAGLVIHGCVRDMQTLGAPVTFAGVTVHEGAFVDADADGLLVSGRPRHEKA